MAMDPEIFAQLRDGVDRFVQDRLRPLEEQVARDDAIPDAIVDEMKAMGLFGLSIPQDYGGLGLDMREEIEIAIRLGHTSPAFRSVFGTNNGIGSQGIIMDGTEAQKQHYLPRLATGEIISSFCLTEPEAGSDAASLKTLARPDADGFRITGSKQFITNAPRADLFTVFARSDPQAKGASSISAFLVPATSAGIRIGKPEKKMGQQGTYVSAVHFDDVPVPADAIIGGPDKAGQGFRTAMKVLDRGRLHISGLCVGIAERLIGEMLGYAIERKQFGQRLADFQLIQGMIADSQAETYAAACMVRDAARLRDEGMDCTTQISCAKMFASEMVGRVADRAVQVHGGAGYISDYAVERLYRDVRLFRIYEGTTQIQQIIIARNLIRAHGG